MASIAVSPEPATLPLPVGIPNADPIPGALIQD
jgi:hypothetical protein